MKIAFDYQIFSTQSYGGISRYFVRLAQELLLLNQDVHVISPIHKNKYLYELPEGRVYGLGFSRVPRQVEKSFRSINEFACYLKLKTLQPKILHETYYSGLSAESLSARRVITVYDMIHEKFPNDFAENDRTSLNKKIAVQRADHIVSISENTKKDLCTIFGIAPSKVSVVHLGFDLFDHGQSCERAMSKPFLLYVGNRSGYKNFSSTLQAVASNPRLKRDVGIVAFGGGPFNTRETTLIGELGFLPGCVRQVSGGDQVLGDLYRGASALIYPSLYEGFGLPPLEAMAHGCPVVSSNASSMPEIIGDAGNYFDPHDIDDQANAIESIMSNESRRKQLVDEGNKRLLKFSWTKCARETLNIYENLT